jgi:hypothetical protein
MIYLKKRKGEVTSQMFMYITAAIIAGVLLLVGGSAIVKLMSTSKTASDSYFKDSLISYFETVNSLSFGSSRIKDFKIMSEFKTMCFISKDLMASPSTANTGYQEIDSSLKASSLNNIYLLSSKSMYSFEVDEISGFDSSLTSNNFYCHDIVGGNVKLTLKSKGDSIEIVNVR